ncbi:hypothetical protein NHX12_028492 [Muraenolepis orangiensis]|uniref:G-protein coupled receptors family 1 profile domain-containing protein n=1 Tax=Muraenolepis orangiensis TaxID=630683 RepID=A0A9Q0EDD8_9TELE|nr:hypothetical protein NHX12_028492 [Muraenolepis orangiensis]
MLSINTTSVTVTGGGGFIPFALELDHPASYLLFIFQYVFATTAVLLAGTVVIGIMATKALLAQNRFIFMLNTCICDTCTGLSVYYLGLFDVQEGYPSRNGTYNMLPALLGVNIMTFLFAQFDRYFAICHPFIYSRFVRRWVVVCITIFCWLQVYSQSVIAVFLPLSKAIEMYVFGVVSLQIIVVTKIAMTIKLYIVANYQLRREPPSAERDNKRESLQIIIVVVVTFLTLWMPSFINIILRLLLRRGLQFKNDSTNPFAIMARLNAITTSVIYTCSSPALRGAMARVWGGRRAGRCCSTRIRSAKK